jgi:hypothetical protein
MVKVLSLSEGLSHLYFQELPHLSRFYNQNKIQWFKTAPVIPDKRIKLRLLIVLPFVSFIAGYLDDDISFDAVLIAS